MNKHWRMPHPTAPLAASVMVVRVIPPMTTVGRGIYPPSFPSPMMTSKDASFRYPPCSGSNNGWRHSPHNGSGEGIDPPPFPSPTIVLEDAPLPYPPCSGSDGGCHHPPHDGSGEESTATTAATMMTMSTAAKDWQSAFITTAIATANTISCRRTYLEINRRQPRQVYSIMEQRQVRQ